MRLADNIVALRVFTNVTRTNRDVARNTMRLSSGYRINRAGDDPAGFSIAIGLRNQVDSKNMANRNTLDGTSLLETADATLQGVQDMVHRIRELAVAMANDTNTDDDRRLAEMEVMNLLQEIDALTNRVEFNTIRILGGEARDLRIQVGGRQGMSVAINIPSFRAEHMGLANQPVFIGLDGAPTVNRANARIVNNEPERYMVATFDAEIFPIEVLEEFAANPNMPNPGNVPSWPPVAVMRPAYWDVNVLTSGFVMHTDDGRVGFVNRTDETGVPGSNPQWTIDVTDDVLHWVSSERAAIGAFINRFEYTSTSLQAASEATTRSLSRIMDTDMAEEMMRLSSNNILVQAGMSIMAQANARPQQILQLLG